MLVNLLFFGATVDIIGSRAQKLNVGEMSSVASLLENLKSENPALAKHKLLFAVNEEYAESDAILKDGDELAIFTAVSGG